MERHGSAAVCTMCRAERRSVTAGSWVGLSEEIATGDLQGGRGSLGQRLGDPWQLPDEDPARALGASGMCTRGGGLGGVEDPLLTAVRQERWCAVALGWPLARRAFEASGPSAPSGPGPQTTAVRPVRPSATSRAGLSAPPQGADGTLDCMRASRSMGLKGSSRQSPRTRARRWRPIVQSTVDPPGG